MLRFLGLLVLLTAAFGAGVYVGRYSAGDWTKTMGKVSRDVLETTISVERSFRGHQGLVDAKAQVIQAKAEVLDRNFGTAARALSDAADDLERAKIADGATDRAAKIAALIAKIRAAQHELTSGKNVGLRRIEEIQKEMEGLNR
ncbi:hypothetical protein [Candidatus Nitrospira bockiana]